MKNTTTLETINNLDFLESELLKLEYIASDIFETSSDCAKIESVEDFVFSHELLKHVYTASLILIDYVERSKNLFSKIYEDINEKE